MSEEGRFTTGGWHPDGTATLEATGADARAALQAGLRAALALVGESAIDACGERRAVPVHGEGADLGSLFADLVADLLAQLDEFGSGLSDVALDGVLRRDDGGYRAWGYASIGDGAAHVTGRLPVIAAVAVDESDQRVRVRATLRRQ